MEQWSADSCLNLQKKTKLMIPMKLLFLKWIILSADVNTLCDHWALNTNFPGPESMPVLQTVFLLFWLLFDIENSLSLPTSFTLMTATTAVAGKKVFGSLSFCLLPWCLDQFLQLDLEFLFTSESHLVNAACLPCKNRKIARLILRQVQTLLCPSDITESVAGS